MMLSEEDLIDKYLGGEIIDPCEYGQLVMEKLDESFGNDEDNV